MSTKSLSDLAALPLRDLEIEWRKMKGWSLYHLGEDGYCLMQPNGLEYPAKRTPWPEVTWQGIPPVTWDEVMAEFDALPQSIRLNLWPHVSEIWYGPGERDYQDCFHTKRSEAFRRAVLAASIYQKGNQP